MLYYFKENGDAVQFSKSMMDTYRKKLAEVFPLSFGGTSKEPVMFNMNPKYKKIMPRFVAGQKDDQIGNTVVYATRRLPTEENVVFPIDGEEAGEAIRRAVRFSNGRPTKGNNGDVKWPKVQMIISDNTALDPDKDFDKIVFLYFFSCESQNGHRAESGMDYAKQHGTGYFEKPDALAKGFLDNETFNFEVHEVLVHPAKRISHEVITEADKIMHVGVTGNEDVDRAKYVAAMKADPAKFERLKRVIADIKPSKSKNDLSQINAKAEAGIKAGLIQIVDGFWCLTTTGGEKQAEICKITQTKKDAQKFELVEALKADPDTVAKLNEMTAALTAE